MVTLMECNIYHVIDAGVIKVIFIIHPELRKLFLEQLLPKLMNEVDVIFVEQNLNNLPNNILLTENRTKLLGTAQAIWCCRNNIDGNFVVINADDYYLVVAFQLDKTLSEFGGVNRGFCQFNKNNILTHIDACNDIKKVMNDKKFKHY